MNIARVQELGVWISRAPDHFWRVGRGRCSWPSGVMAVALWLAAGALLRWYRAGEAAEAVWVAISPPARLPRDGGEKFAWSVAGLLGRTRRFGWASRHLVLELVATDAGIIVGVWVPPREVSTEGGQGFSLPHSAIASRRVFPRQRNGEYWQRSRRARRDGPEMPEMRFGLGRPQTTTRSTHSELADIVLGGGEHTRHVRNVLVENASQRGQCRHAGVEVGEVRRRRVQPQLPARRANEPGVQAGYRQRVAVG